MNGAGTVRREGHISNLDALKKLNDAKPPNSYRWFVFAYVVNENIIKEDGSIENIFGVLLPLASFPDSEKAEEYAKIIAYSSGYRGIIVCPRLAPIPLLKERDEKTRSFLIQKTNKEGEKKLVEILKKHDDEYFEEMNEKAEKAEKMENFLEACKDPHLIEYTKLIKEKETLEKRIFDLNSKAESLLNNIKEAKLQNM